jgi:hypothetical protein
MSRNKTTETTASVEAYVAAIGDENGRKDCAAMIELFARETGFAPKMWGTAIVGFGCYHYKYESGREGEAPLTALSARAKEFSLYLPVFDGRDALLSRMGKHKIGKGCVYVTKLADLDAAVLAELVREGVAHRGRGAQD